MPTRFTRNTVNNDVAYTNPVRCSISKDGSILAITSGSGGNSNWQVSKRNPATGVYETLSKGSISIVAYNIAVSHDNQHVYIFRSTDSTIQRVIVGATDLTLDTAWGTYTCDLNVPGYANLFAVSPDSTHLAVSAGNSTATYRFVIIRTDNKQTIFTPSLGTGSEFLQGEFSGDGTYFFAARSSTLMVFKRTGTHTYTKISQQANAEGNIPTPYGFPNGSSTVGSLMVSYDGSILVYTQQNTAAGIRAFIRGENDLYTQVQTPLADGYTPTNFYPRGGGFMGDNSQYLVLADVVAPTSTASPAVSEIYQVGVPGNGMLKKVANTSFTSVPEYPSKLFRLLVSRDGAYMYSSEDTATRRNNVWKIEIPREVTGVLALPGLGVSGRFERVPKISGTLALAGLSASGTLKLKFAASGSFALQKLGVSGALVADNKRQVQGVIALPKIGLSGQLAQANRISGALSLSALAVSGQLKSYLAVQGSLGLPRLDMSGELSVRSSLEVDGVLPLGPLSVEAQAAMRQLVRGNLRLGDLSLAGVLALDSDRTVSGELVLPGLGLSGELDATNRAAGALPLGGLSLTGSLAQRLKASGALPLARLSLSGTATARLQVSGVLALSAFSLAGELVATEQSEVFGVLALGPLGLAGRLSFGQDDNQSPFVTRPSFTQGTTGSFSLAAQTFFGKPNDYKVG